DLARPRRAAAALPSRGHSSQRSQRVAGRLPPLLGGELPAPRRVARRAQSQRNKTRPPQAARRSAMKNTGTLEITTPTDRESVMTRVFDAPRHLVFDAFTKPELLKR